MLFFLTAEKLVFVFVLFCSFPHAQKLVRFFLATQNDGPFPEWMFLANRFIFRLNFLSLLPDECALKKHFIWKGPSPEFSKNLWRRMKLLGFFALLFLHVSFPSFLLLSSERPCFFDSTNLSEAETEGTLRHYYRNEWRAKSFLSFSVSSSQHGKPTLLGHRA